MRRVIYVRDDGALQDRLDQVVIQVRRRRRGATPTRAEIARELLYAALDDPKIVRRIGGMPSAGA